MFREVRGWLRRPHNSISSLQKPHKFSTRESLLGHGLGSCSNDDFGAAHVGRSPDKLACLIKWFFVMSCNILRCEYGSGYVLVVIVILCYAYSSHSMFVSHRLCIFLLRWLCYPTYRVVLFPKIFWYLSSPLFSDDLMLHRSFTSQGPHTSRSTPGPAPRPVRPPTVAPLHPCGSWRQAPSPQWHHLAASVFFWETNSLITRK